MFTLPTDFWRYSWALFAVCAVLSNLSTAQARTWTTVEGKEVEAELVEVVQDGKAVILDVKGNRFTVPLERLSPKDRAHVQGLEDTMPTLSDAELQKEIDQAVSDDERGVNDNSSDPIRLTAKRIWRSREGVAVEAQFIRMVQGTIVLREGSRYHRIQFYDLSVDDRQFLSDAHKAIGKSALIPPVRPDLLDAAPQTSEPPAYRDHPPVPSSPMAGPVKTPPKQTQVNLPDNGFGSASDNVKLPPGGFGAAQESTKLPPGGFGSASGLGSNVNLPPSGFGTAPSSKQADASSDSSVKLPSGGFGSASPPAEATEDQGASTSVPSPSSPTSVKVGVPSSTITETPNAQPGSSESPLFDVASVPNRSSGFGSSQGDPAAPSSNSPELASNTDMTSPTSTGGTLPGDSKKPSPSTGSNPAAVSDKDFKAHTYTPSSDFQPLQVVEDREFTTADWNVQMFGVLLLALGSLMISGGYLWLIALAFLESLEVGLRSLIPGMAIVHGFSDTEKSSVPLLGMLLGICLTLGGFGLLMGVS